MRAQRRTAAVFAAILAASCCLNANAAEWFDWTGSVTGSEFTSLIKGKNVRLHDGASLVAEVGASKNGASLFGTSAFKGGTYPLQKGKWEFSDASTTVNVRFVFTNPELFAGNPSEITLFGDTEGKTYLKGQLLKLFFADDATDEQKQSLYENLTLVAPAVSQKIDGIQTEYLLEAEIGKTAFNSTWYSWGVKSLKLTNTQFASESVRSAADNQRALFNMWRLNDSHVFRRGESLRMGHEAQEGNTWQESEPKVAEGLWANVYRGKYKFDSPYGRKVNQSYTSFFVGIDKMNEGDFHNGTLYRGVFADIGTSDASYPTGKGELESKGLGAYVTWQGNKGHFLDAAIRFDKLDNEYTYVDSNGKSGKNKYDTWAWGVSGQYGYHKDWGSGVYIEPLVGLSYGRMNATSYTLHNKLEFDQKGGDFLVGRAGLRFGKVYKDALSSNETNIYGKVMLSHEFLDAADASTTFAGNVLKVKPIGERDTWADVTFGINRSFSKRGSGYVELTKSIGGGVKSDWQVAAGLSFYWDPEPKYHGGPREETNAQLFTAANSTGTATVLAPNAVVSSAEAGGVPETGAETLAETAGAAAAGAYSANAAQTNAEGSGYGTTSFSRAGTYGSAESGVYELAPVTVEADRPVWEKNLSPGTVSVVYPEAYKGEMKTVPDMLDSVAGVLVQRINGTGHYTLARIRGSTGQQVNVYVDGVLMNSSGETGVDLSQLPTEQIERIEVYKGYIPARFAGAAIGGAINIVTKKPDGATGSVGFGMRSYGGYTGNLSVTTPVGDGTLLFTLNRDQANGEFGYNWYPPSDSEWMSSITEYGGRVWRQNNWYRMTDAMVKWQDDHWLVKAQYVEKNEGSPLAANGTTADNWWEHHGVPTRGPNPLNQKNKNTDILIGRRQQTGDLEWGAYLNYGYHEKLNEYHGKYTQYVPAGVSAYFKHNFWGARLDGSWKLNDSNLLEFLFNYSDETMRTDGNTFGSKNMSTDLPNYYRKFLPRYDIRHYYFQVQDSMALDRRKTLIFTPEWRAEKLNMTTLTKGQKKGAIPSSDNETDWKYSYGLGLKKYVSDNWTFHGSYGTYYRAPNFYEIFGDGGIFVLPKKEISAYVGSALTYESGTQYDFGTDWKGKTLGADTNLSLTYFNRHVKNMAAPMYVYNGSLFYTNLGQGKIDGIEFEADWSWKNWELSQSVTWNHSFMEKVTTNYGGDSYDKGAIDVKDRKIPFSMTPEWETNTRLSYFFHDRKMSAFAEYHYTSEMLYNVGPWTKDPKNGVNGGRPAYYTAVGIFNLGFKYNPEHWRFTVGVNDLFNKGPKQRFFKEAEKAFSGVPYPQQGRTYYFSAQYSF